MPPSRVPVAIGCSNCHRALIQTFLSISITSNKSLPTTVGPHATSWLRSSKSYGHNIVQSRRHFSHTRSINTADNSVQPVEATEKDTRTQVHTPWYLQVQSPGELKDYDSPIASRQRLPDLPDHPPPLLQSFLEHISMDLGLDDLTLLDLRKLDPPPALGSNLLMVIGTARSEKHLHVSADRFCRWLRSTHKLRAHAAGLLGRNELKIKMRRKAKRSRLMSNVGTSETSNLDDGIRTAWICVTMDRVPAAESTPQLNSSIEHNIIGFSNAPNGVTIVVQMFTEESRNEIDLESLWNGVLRRVNSPKEPARVTNEKPDDPPTDSDPSKESHANSNSIVDSADISYRSRSAAQPTIFTQRTRMLHTLANTTLGSPLRPVRFGFPATLATSRQHREVHTTASVDVGENSDLNIPSSKTVDLYGTKSKSGYGSSISSPMEVPFTVFSDEPIHQESVLNGLISQILSSPKEQAIQFLGKGWEDRTSTSFLRTFYSHFPTYLTPYHWDAIMRLWTYAVELNHNGYPAFILVRLAHKMQLAAFQPTEEMLRKAVSAVLLSQHTEQSGISTLNGRLRQALKILRIMDTYNYKILDKETLLSIHRAVTTGSVLGTRETPSRRVRIVQKQQRQRFRTMIDSFNLSSVDAINNVELMKSYAKLGDWEGFWDLWDSFPRRMSPRSAVLYKTVFEEVANCANQENCQQTLGKCIPEMELEAPSVTIESELATAILRCLRTAEPKVTNPNLHGTIDQRWADLYKECRNALESKGGIR